MLRKILFSILAVLCSISAFSLNIRTLQGTDIDRFVEPEAKDTSSHKLFHSKFGYDVKFPKLTDDASKNAVILSNFFSKFAKKRDAKVETFIALVPLLPKKADSISVETLKKMLPIRYRCFYSASMEYLLFCEMGGKNGQLRQVFYAYRAAASATFTPLCHKFPDVYCAQLDSVSAFLKNLDYLGDIYPEIQEDHRKHGNGPAVYYKVPGKGGSIGLISAVHGSFCESCNRIRLTSMGYIKPCLCYEEGVFIRPYLEKEDDELRQVFKEIIKFKPARHCFENVRAVDHSAMAIIGG